MSATKGAITSAFPVRRPGGRASRAAGEIRPGGREASMAVIRCLAGLVLALALLRGGVALWAGARGVRAKPYGILMPGPVRPPRSFTPSPTE